MGGGGKEGGDEGRGEGGGGEGGDEGGVEGDEGGGEGGGHPAREPVLDAHDQKTGPVVCSQSRNSPLLRTMYALSHDAPGGVSTLSPVPEATLLPVLTSLSTEQVLRTHVTPLTKKWSRHASQSASGCDEKPRKTRPS